MHRAALRIASLAALFATEAILATAILDGNADTTNVSWLTGRIHLWGPAIARFGVAFSGIFATFALLRFRGELSEIATAAAAERIRWRYLWAHAAAIVLFAVASAGVYLGRMPVDAPNAISAVWILSAVSAIAFAALGFLPLRFWLGVRRATGLLWVGCCAAAAVMAWAVDGSRSLWQPASRATFVLVKLMLAPFVHEVFSQPERFRIGTDRFKVIIADSCSGLEGIGLMLVFGLMWLVLFRKESRFPHALVLLPLAVVALFVLNAARITGLILIGHAGARDIAVQGFHSQAGWMAFNCVAFACSIAARRWSWIAVPGHLADSPRLDRNESEETAAYLVPFLAILAAGMVARAASGQFEYLYPLRCVAGLSALWVFRGSYSRMNWSGNVVAPLAGVFVFVAWIAADRLTGATSGAASPAELSGLAPWARFGWLGFRVLGAVATAPIAEELAFRGFLMRRLVGADFAAVRFEAVGWIAIAVSSIAFGAMHGQRWGGGALAGLTYALLVKRTGRLGDAVVAHSVTNASIAAYVLYFHQWQLW